MTFGREQHKQPKIGLALSGGAARGIAHIGVLRALEEHQIKPDCIAGTSAGSLVGGAMASGMELTEIRMTMSRLGIQSNERLEQYLRERLPVTRFEDLPTPFAAVATDLNSGAEVVMGHQGDLPFAIRASCAIPGWYVPVMDEYGRQLVDGGLVANIPSGVARSLGAEIVIAVDVNAEGARFLGPSLSILSVVLQSMLLVQRTAAVHQLEKADVIIRPKVGHIRWDEMRRAEELIAAGYDAAIEMMPEIKQIIGAASEFAPKWYQLRRRKASRV